MHLLEVADSTVLAIWSILFLKPGFLFEKRPYWLKIPTGIFRWVPVSTLEVTFFGEMSGRVFRYSNFSLSEDKYNLDTTKVESIPYTFLWWTVYKTPLLLRFLLE